MYIFIITPPLIERALLSNKSFFAMLTMIFLYSVVIACFLFSSSVDGRLMLQKDSIINSSEFLRENDTAVSLASDTTYTGKTNPTDVLGLLLLCSSFQQLVENNDDPCLPPRWSWIQCNSDPRPRVTGLDLSNRYLVGLLPDFSIMGVLQKIDLSDNMLYGSIPSFLGKFTDLQELNLAYNLYSGLVPDSLACNKDLNLTLSGNTNLFTSGTCSTSSTPSNKVPSSDRNTDSSSGSGGGGGGDSSSSSSGDSSSFPIPTKRRSKKKSKSLPIILGTTISAFSVVWIAVGVFLIQRHKAKSAAAAAEASSTTPADVKKPNPDETPMEEMPIRTASSSDTSSP